MTYDATATPSPAAARRPLGYTPLAAWHAVCRAGSFMLDVAEEAGQLRRSLHRLHPVTEE